MSELFEKPVDELVAIARSQLQQATAEVEKATGKKAAHILNFSGGKDSTAMYLLAHELGVPFEAFFADTEWERPEVYEQVALVSKRVNAPPVRTIRADMAGRLKTRRDKLRAKLIEQGKSKAKIAHEMKRLKSSGNAFIDMVKLKRRFPSTHRRFCTETLKVLPIRDQAYQPAWDAGAAVISWQGIRAAESYKRAAMPTLENLAPKFRKKDGDVYAFRPLMNWSLDNVWAMHERHGVPRNKLYDLGAWRVGCWPCIMASKAEIANIANLDPEKIKLIADIELEMTSYRKPKQGTASFFMHTAAPGGAFGIDEIVKWASTDIKHWYQHKAEMKAAQQDRELEPWEVKAWKNAMHDKSATDACDLFGMCE